jgi:magnesium transporter
MFKTAIMPKSINRLSHKTGLPPGSLVYVGEKTEVPVKLSIIDYSHDVFSEKIIDDVEELNTYKESDTVSWINIDGLHDLKIIERLGQVFGLHALLMEDMLNTHHRPKVEEFDNCIYVSLKMLNVDKSKDEIISEQVSIILGNGWVITLQEQEGDIFEILRDRLRKSFGSIRQRKADYLFYRFIDMVVDHYFFVTEYLSEVIEQLEEKVIGGENKDLVLEIQGLKRQLIELRRLVSPLREVVAFLNKETSGLISDNINRYLIDVYEHIIMVNETIESQKDTIASVMDLYMSGVSNRMNQVMKVLTIIATIFIPLSFIAGVYGMNFDHIPELHWRYGYFIFWAIITSVVIVMLFYFRRKKWL